MPRSRAQLPWDEAQKRWQKRADRLRRQTPKSFKGAARIAHVQSQVELQSMVYGQSAGPNTRTGQLQRMERLRFEGESEAEIYNAKTSIWRGDRTNVATIIHEGRDPIRTPTRRGRQWLLWTFNRGTPRPRGRNALSQWYKLKAAGKAAMAKSVRAVRGRPWRNVAMQKCHKKVAQFVRATAVQSVLRMKPGKK